jgi:hypothetical protein
VSAVKQAPVETVAQARSCQLRAENAAGLGIGAEGCLTQRCHVQLAFATGQQYAEPHSPCEPCRARMSSWGTRPVGTTGYFRLPARHLWADLMLPQAVPGTRTSVRAVDAQIEVAA